MTSSLIEPFRVDIPQADIDELRTRLKAARWPEQEPVDDWSQGVPLARLRALCAYWADGYDWRRCETRLNSFPQYRTTVDGLAIHFIHRPSSRADALPLIMTHGWPGSVIEFLDVIDRLAEPEDPSQPAFHVVVPSGPGYGFSDRPGETGWGFHRIAPAWVEIMRRLGYKRFVAQGGDWGAFAAIAIAALEPPELIGIHLNMPVVYPQKDMQPWTAAEQAAADKLVHHARWGDGYSKIQGTRPQTLGYGLADSPIGQAAWIYEKMYEWTDNDGNPEDALSMDQMLDNISLYWFTNTGTSAARLYWQEAVALANRELHLPIGVSAFPGEVLRPSLRWVERFYTNVVYWNELDRGGHFGAWEEPDLFVSELRACFGKAAFRP